ncbi:alpha,alpha-trehalose-phosphate synthase (UDP-forming) [Halegenticoccus soli]|uniref:alpha,alpha-trehalose-phosphate synthase (UDP-forming) n=1 Tax=Halegenticoccus soli TaxID=1985678 RepID=UPI000C6D96E4|nr:trehalose-6-phosphate synthase [Halegenticoccus soli]
MLPTRSNQPSTAEHDVSLPVEADEGRGAESDSETGAESEELGDLVVVSNRQPYRHNYVDESNDITVDRPVGGLTAGLDRVMQQIDGLWIAWGDADADPVVVDAENRVRVPPDDPSYTLERVWLDERAIQDYYYGFSNQVLWPLCHDLVDKMEYEEAYWERYRDVNETFADVVVDAAGDSSLVWFQDYHLALAPRIARSALPESTTLMQFWHIPWPAWDTFRVCPRRRELIEGLLANDLLGFHIERYRENFLQSVDACLDGATVDFDAGEVTYDGHTTVVEAFPMGVDADRIARLSAEADEAFWSSFKERFGIPSDAQVAVGVDRLDYTKGIPERLDALAQFWETHPERRGTFTYVQRASESRSAIPAYQQLGREVEARVAEINDRFGTDDWRPVVYIDEHLDDEELYGMYRHSDLALVSPIRDGMNLVAKEYVAAQIDEDGVLLLSTLAGADEELGEDAMTVEPYDTESFADAIETALEMPVEERRRRMQTLRESVAANDLDDWIRTVLNRAQSVGAGGSGASESASSGEGGADGY